MPNDDEELLDIDVTDDSEIEIADEQPDNTESLDANGRVKDDEFEYDKDGNIIIPEVEEEDEAAGAEEAHDEDNSDSNVEEPKQTPKESTYAESEADKRYAELQKKYDDLLSQSKDTLKAMGIKDEDALEGLARVAAENNEISLTEYKKSRAEARANEESAKAAQKVAFEQQAAKDLLDLQTAFPETKAYKHITEIPNIQRFGQLRDMGLSPKEAYVAANPDAVRNQVATAVKKQSLQDTKSHLRSSVPKGSKDTSTVRMTRAELNEWRGLFPNKSDKEIAKLYRDTN